MSTSFGLDDRDKVYLDMALDGHYDSALSLREGQEIRKLCDSPRELPARRGR